MRAPVNSAYAPSAFAKVPHVYSPDAPAPSTLSGGGLYDLMSSRWTASSALRKSVTSSRRAAASTPAFAAGGARFRATEGGGTAHSDSNEKKSSEALNIFLH